MLPRVIVIIKLSERINAKVKSKIVSEIEKRSKKFYRLTARFRKENQRYYWTLHDYLIYALEDFDLNFLERFSDYIEFVKVFELKEVV